MVWQVIVIDIEYCVNGQGDYSDFYCYECEDVFEERENKFNYFEFWFVVGFVQLWMIKGLKYNKGKNLWFFVYISQLFVRLCVVLFVMIQVCSLF